MRMDGQTGTTKLIAAFQNFANAPKIVNGRELMIGNRDSCRALRWKS